jgi:hypothetical protein
LFLTGATIVGDLIALINVYLNGEISSRFIYKILAVLVISGVVFVYYLLAKTQGSADATSNQNHRTRTIFAWIGIILVIVAIVAGFIAVGSPTKQRNLRFDSQRVSDLTNIQWQIINHWQQKRALPATLADLSDSIGGYTVPTDPKSKVSYEYSIIVSTSSIKTSASVSVPVAVSSPTSASIKTQSAATKPSFELCATFALPTQDNKGRGDFYGSNSYPTMAIDSSYRGLYYGSDNDNWKHDVGHACFTRTIDPDRYPVIPVKPMAD